MRIVRSSFIPAAIIAVGIAALAAGAGGTAANDVPATTTDTAIDNLTAATADTPGRIAKLLDAIIQPRFEEDAGTFGVSRIASFVGHEFVTLLNARNESEKRLLDQANGINRDYVIAFLHCIHPPGKLRDGRIMPVRAKQLGRPYLQALAARGPLPAGVNAAFSRGDDYRPVFSLGRERSSELKRIQDLAIAKLPRLMKGESAATETKTRDLFFRPVRASKESCVSCHLGAKQGDTLGVMVYSVAKEASPAQP